MAAYYNENDPYAAEWLRRLIAAGHVAPGDVDERSIEDVGPDDLRGYKQCHFFAGIGGWSYALRLAGYPDDRAVWTGSCPCQPFSAAGKGKGFADERHLWPAWFHLVRYNRPQFIFGEQVASNLTWLDLVQTDLEGQGYAVGAAVIGAHSVGAPHIRHRLYWMANADGRDASAEGVQRSGQHGQQSQDGSAGVELAEPQGEQPHGSGDARRGRGQPADGGWLGDASSARGGRNTRAVPGAESGSTGSVRSEPNKSESSSSQLGIAASSGRERIGDQSALSQPVQTDPWASSEWLPCRDGKARPVEPGTFPLAHGIPNRVGRLRAYGNAIVPQAAAAFVKAALCS